jgi:hypothetical protein
MMIARMTAERVAFLGCTSIETMYLQYGRKQRKQTNKTTHARQPCERCDIDKDLGI